MQSIDYRPLEDGATHPTEGFTVYQRGVDQVYPYTDIVTARSFQVVQGITRTVNGTVTAKQYFAYKGATLHLQGLGFLGFEGSAQSNRHTSYSNRIFSVVLTSPQLRGAPIQQHSQLYTPVFSGSVTGYITKTVHTYQSELLSNKVFKLKNTQSVEQNALDGTTVTRQAQYDAYNNIIQESTAYTGLGTVTANFTYTNSTGTPYFIGRPASATITRTLNGQAAFVTTEQWDYTTASLVSQHRWKGNGIANFNKEDFTYDSYGNLLTKTITPYSSTARTVSFTYDATKRFMTGSTDVEGLTATATYNAVTGLKLSETNAFSQTVSFAYDAWGRLTTTTDIYGKQTTAAYTKNSTNYNYTIAGSAQSGAATEQEFDPLKRLIRESYKDALGQWVNVKTEYDAMGRPWRKSEPYTGTAPSQWTATEYDVYSRPVKVTLPAGKVTNMSYSGLSVTVNDGTKTTVTTKNAIGLVTTQQDPGGSVNYTYYSNGAMKTADYGGSTQTLEQDGWGRKTKLTDPSAGVYVYQYNAWDELTGENSPKGNTAYQYDAKGKLTQKTVTGDASTGDVPTSMVTVYAYDATTKLPTGVTLTNADGNNSTTTFSYDSYKRVSQTVEENPKARFTKAFGYDAFGRTGTETQTALNKSNNKTATQNLSYTYQNNVLKKITTTEVGAVWELTGLNARGQVTTASLGSGGLQQQNTYDNYGLPTGEKLVKQGTELFNYGYTWNAQRGLLTGRSTTLFTSGGQALTESFQYDALDRLTQWSNPATGAALTQSYDTRGRISSNGAIGTYTYASATTYLQKDVTLNTAGQAYYSGHELQQAVYNNFKQPVTVTEPGKDKITFQYGAGGERAHMQWGCPPLQGTGAWGSARYQRHYSADGTMEITEDAQTSTTTFIFYTGGNAYSAPAIRRQYYSPSGDGGEMLYLHRDHLGSIIAITDGNGVIKEKRHFDAWGNLAKLQNGSGTTLGSFTITDRGYTGHEHLTVGLVHMNGRLYDPALHRFLMPDNYVQDPSNTQNFNRYAYVLNNPLGYVDPSGEAMIIPAPPPPDPLQGMSLWSWVGFNTGHYASTSLFQTGETAMFAGNFSSFGSGGSGVSNGTITPAMVETYYQQQWVGMGRNNISASYSAKGGFNVMYNFDPGVGNGTGVGNLYVSDGEMEGLMGEENSPWTSAFATIGILAADDVTGIGAIDDIAIPIILAGAAVYDLTQRVYVTYTLTGPQGQKYAGRASGFGTPQSVMMSRYASHHMRAFGYRNPTLDVAAQGADAYLAIRGREQQLIDFYGGVGNPNVGNSIRGVWYYNPAGRVFHKLSDLYFGPLAPYTGF
ncbi:MAG: RHS repeat-associated core domain-containing protein [Agriterribacter sp.]